MIATLPVVDASFVLGVALSSGASAVVEEVVVDGCAVVPSMRGVECVRNAKCQMLCDGFVWMDCI